MNDYYYVPIKNHGLHSYVYRAVVAPDGMSWTAYCPALLREGAFVRAATRRDALKGIEMLVQHLVTTLIDAGASVPEDVIVAGGALVAVTAEV